MSSRLTFLTGNTCRDDVEKTRVVPNTDFAVYSDNNFAGYPVKNKFNLN